MATNSTADSPTDGSRAADASAPDRTDDGPSLADRLETVGRAIWVAFLAVVVVFTLIPVMALALGAAPFDPPPTTPYFALVGLALVGAAGLVGGAIYDV